MRVRALVILVTLLVAGLLAGTVAALAQDEEGLQLAIRDTRLQPDGTTELVVSVTGTARPDVLAADAFTVSEQDEPVTGLQVEPLLESDAADVAVSLAIDVSGSMIGEPMAVTREAAAALAEDLTEQGVRVQVIAFAAEVEILTAMTDDTDVVTSAIEGLEASGATLLYDAVIVAAEQLIDDGGQPNLVVFSDGADNGSNGTIEDVIAAAEDAEVAIVTVALETDDLDPDALDRMAAETGGRVLTAESLDELGALFDEVATDIASQYVLRYESTRLTPATLALDVSVSAAGASAQTSFVVPNTREETVEAVAPRIIERDPGLTSSPLVLYGAVVAAFIGLMLLFTFLFTGSRGVADHNLDQQLSRYIQHGDLRVGRSSVVSAHFRDRAREMLEATPRPKGFDAEISRRLEQAAWPLKNGEFLGFVAASWLGVTVVTGLAVNWVGGILLGLVAGAVPFAILEVRRSRRHDLFLRQLPDTLQLMAGSLRAGYAVLQAVDSVAKEASPPTSEEFGRVLTEARLGMPLEDALQDMADRIDNADFRWVVMAINIQREVGGNLAELLDTVAEVLREREMLRRQIKVLSAEGRLSAWILIGLPIVLTIYLVLVRPEYIGTLVTSGAFGWLLVGGASVLMVAGVVWIRKLIRIEV